MNRTLILFVCLMCLPTAAFATPVICEDGTGTCTLRDNQSGSCTCSNGSASDFGSSDMPAPSEEYCFETLASHCADNSVPITVLESCETEKGECNILSEGDSMCICATGNPEHEYGGTVCDEVLAQACPEDPPDPAASCAPNVLAFCTEYVNFIAGCYHDFNVWPFLVIDCCWSHEDDDAAHLTELTNCFRTKTCYTLNLCDDQAGDGDYGTDIGTSADTEGGSTSTDSDVVFAVETDADTGLGDYTGGTNSCAAGGCKSFGPFGCSQPASDDVLLITVLMMACLLIFRRRFAG